MDEPVITLVEPDEGRLGDEITITGTLFGPVQDESTVEINGVECEVVSWSNTMIVCIVPDTDSGDVVVNSMTNNVMSYGATGDGTTDDTDAIQDAIDDLPPDGSILYFPAGTYLVTASAAGGHPALELVSDVKVVLDSAAEIILDANGYDQYAILSLTSLSNVTIMGGTITGDRATHTGGTGETGHGISVWDCQNVVIDGVTVNNCWGDGIDVDGTTALTSKNVTIQNCTSNHNRRCGIAIQNLDTGLIYNNVSTNNDGTSPMSGIGLEPWDAGQSIINVVVSDNTCTGNDYGMACSGHSGDVSLNTITGNTVSSNIHVGMGLDEMEDCIVEYNIVDDNTVCGIGLYGCSGTTPGDFLVEGNTITDTTNGNGILLEQGQWGTGVPYTANCLVQNNSFTGSTASDPGTGYGCFITHGAHDNEVTNNDLAGNDSGTFGFWAEGLDNTTAPNSPQVFQPDPHPETSSWDGDGYAFNDTFANLQAGATAVDATAAGLSINLTASGVLNQYAFLYRAFLVFDCSILPDDAIVDSATLSVMPYAEANTLGMSAAQSDLVLALFTPSSNTDITLTDWTTIGVSAGNRVHYADLVSNVYSYFTLNTAGKAAIDPAGHACFAVLLAVDFDDGTPSWVSGAETTVNFFADEVGDAFAPILEVTYHVP
jgi:hypothetical protein